MKYFLIAGEPSGDQHAARLIRALKDQDREAKFSFFGGDLMEQEAGMEAEVHMRDLAYMGFTQLFSHVFQIWRNFRRCRQAINRFRPDAVIPVDYGGFNLRMIRWAKKQSYRVVYYIPPKAWAWMPRRSRTLARYTDKVLAVLPFEEDFFRSRGVNCRFVGNPVVEEVLPWLARDKGRISSDMGLYEKKVVALLPGSRNQEISKMLPLMVQMASRFPGYHFIIAAHERFSEAYFTKFTKDHPVAVIRGRTRELLAVSHAALVTSGTATLETALLGVPQTACYKTSPVSFIIARLLIRVRYISLVNLILDRPCVPELIQGGFNEKSLGKNLDMILCDQEVRDQMIRDYRELQEGLGTVPASARAAAAVISIAANR